LTGTQSRDLEWIHRCNLILLALMALAGLSLGRLDIMSGLIVGGLISFTNYRMLTRIISQAMTPGSSKPAFAAKIMIKFTGLMAAVAIVLLWAPVNSIAFVIGISLTFISLGLSGLVHLFRGQTANPESTDA
jgi:hypothetical protein